MNLLNKCYNSWGWIRILFSFRVRILIRFFPMVGFWFMGNLNLNLHFAAVFAIFYYYYLTFMQTYIEDMNYCSKLNVFLKIVSPLTLVMISVKGILTEYFTSLYGLYSYLRIYASGSHQFRYKGQSLRPKRWKGH